MPSLSNPHLHFSFDLNTGRWSLYPQRREAPYLEDVRLGAAYKFQSKSAVWEGVWADVRAEAPVQADSVHGRLSVLKIRGRTSLLRKQPIGLQGEVEFALPADRPFLLWRVKAHNAGDQPLALETIDLAVVGRQSARTPPTPWPLQLLFGLGGPEASSGALRLHASPGRLAFFSNGYQSWSFAGALHVGMRQPSSHFGPLGDPKRVNLRTPKVRGRGHFASDMFGVMGDLDHKAGVVAGFISQREQFGHVEARLDSFAPSLRLAAQCDGVALPPGETRATDWAYVQFVELGAPDPLAEYVEAVARENHARVPTHTPVGWCSWYHYFDKVSERDLTGNLEAIVKERERLPLDFVQLDDGYQAQVGDWFDTNDKFPHGLAWLAQHIRAQGHTPACGSRPTLFGRTQNYSESIPTGFCACPRGDWRTRATTGSAGATDLTPPIPPCAITFGD